MGEQALSRYTYEAYLAVEAESETKYEFHDGFITAMAGGSPEHGQIAGNFIGSLRNGLQAAKKRCITYTSDVKIHIAATRRTFYPDVFLVCEKPERSEKDSNAITNPLLILEVLSDSTASFDYGVKFSHYRKIPSLREYLLISQHEAMVDTYYRTDDGTWEIHTYYGLQETILLKSIGCEMKMADVYWLVAGIDE